MKTSVSLPLGNIGIQLLLLPGVFVVGCGESDSSPPRESNPIIETVRSDEEPVRYQLADEACQAGQDTLPLTGAKVHAWDGERVSPMKVALLGVQSAASLTSPAITSTTYDDRFSRLCDWSRPSGLECIDANGAEISWGDADRPRQNLRVCQPDSDYPRLSFERVGLSAVHGIEAANRTYRAIDADAHPLEPIQLSVLPHFVDYYDNFPAKGQNKRLMSWIVHNMAYFPSAKMIAVFPEAAKDAESAKGFFWESRFVLAHEYGHHVELTRLGRPATQVLGLEWDPIRHGYIDLPREAKGMVGRGVASQIFGSFSEAYADLLAFYVEGGDTRTLIGLPCFGKNRDVGKDRFGNGEEKILTEDRLSLLLREEAEGEKPCGEPVYADIHTGGAIVAATLDRSFALLSGLDDKIAPGTREDFVTRYKLALAWHDAVDRRTLALHDAPEVTKEMLMSLLTQGLEDATAQWMTGLSLTESAATQAVRKQVCEVIRDRLPAFPTPPFALTGGRC